MADDPLKLTQLPQMQAPEGLWDAIAQQLDESDPVAPSQPRRVLPWSLAAAAAGLALILTLMQGQSGPLPMTEAPASQLAQLQTLSKLLEMRLDDNRYGVVNATTADSVARLEQEVAWLDMQINASPSDTTLWAERVALLGEINQRYERNDWRNEIMLASY